MDGVDSVASLHKKVYNGTQHLKKSKICIDLAPGAKSMHASQAARKPFRGGCASSRLDHGSPFFAIFGRASGQIFEKNLVLAPLGLVTLVYYIC